jgi:hypothetical protein
MIPMTVVKATKTPPANPVGHYEKTVAESQAATSVLRSAFQKHITVPQDPGKNRTS